MRVKKYTDIFTGVAFDGVTDPDNNIIVTHPITKQEFKITYDQSAKTYTMPESALKYIPTISVKDASQRICTSPECIRQACKNKRLKSTKLKNGQIIIEQKELDKYSQNKRVGRPKKKREKKCEE